MDDFSWGKTRAVAGNAAAAKVLDEDEDDEDDDEDDDNLENDRVLEIFCERFVGVPAFEIAIV